MPVASRRRSTRSTTDSGMRGAAGRPPVSGSDNPGPTPDAGTLRFRDRAGRAGAKGHVMNAREGSLDAPTRHAIDWRNPDYADAGKIDAELRRVFDICHGCRRCFNLCDAFPRLFDLIDEAPSGELDTVESKDFKGITDACTFCDMCFMTKCPYVPPHEFDLDFPHLMLRVRAAEFRRGEPGFFDRRIADTDANGRLGTMFSPLANWACRKDNGVTRPAMEAIAGIDRKAELPKFNRRSLVARAAAEPLEPNAGAPAFGRKALIYATCFPNWNEAAIGEGPAGAFSRATASRRGSFIPPVAACPNWNSATWTRWPGAPEPWPASSFPMSRRAGMSWPLCPPAR